MRYLLLLALLLTPSLSWGGMAAKRMMAVISSYPAVSSGATSFETGYDGWTSSNQTYLFRTDSYGAQDGSYSMIYTDTVQGLYNLTQRIGVATNGTLVFSVLTPSTVAAQTAVTVTIDSISAGTYTSSTANTWTQYAIPVGRGWHNVTFGFYRGAATGTGKIGLDNIIISTPTETAAIATSHPNQSSGIYDTETYGQSWTPTESGNIYSISVKFYQLPNPNVSMKIRTGNSANLSTTYDTEQTFSLAGKSAGVEYEFVLNPQPAFTSGVKKYIMFGNTGAYSDNFTFYQNNSNVYASGGALPGTSWNATENGSNDMFIRVKKR